MWLAMNPRHRERKGACKPWDKAVILHINEVGVIGSLRLFWNKLAT